jgi:hypothetical protein
MALVPSGAGTSRYHCLGSEAALAGGPPTIGLREDHRRPSLLFYPPSFIPEARRNYSPLALLDSRDLPRSPIVTSPPVSLQKGDWGQPCPWAFRQTCLLPPPFPSFHPPWPSPSFASSPLISWDLTCRCSLCTVGS